MDENTQKTVNTVVDGLSGKNGHFVFIAMLTVLFFVGIAGFSYIFLQALEKQASNCSADFGHYETKLDAMDKSISDLILSFALLNQKIK